MKNETTRLTPQQVADEIKRQLTGGHNAGRSITQALAVEALDTIERLLSRKHTAVGCGCKVFKFREDDGTEGSAECVNCGHKARLHRIPGCVGANDE